MKRLLPAIAALALLGACEAKIGKTHGQSDSGNGIASADGKSKEGQFSIKAPGFDMKVDLPDSIAAHASFHGDSEIVYPGAKFSGMHIEGAKHGGVEIRFTSADAPDKVAAWYRDPARKDDFTIASDSREGAGYAFAGTQGKDSDPYSLHLSPRVDGGTDGRLTMTDKD